MPGICDGAAGQHILQWDGILRAQYARHCAETDIAWYGLWLMGPSVWPGTRQLAMPWAGAGVIGSGGAGVVN